MSISQPVLDFFSFPLPASILRYSDASSLKAAIKAVKYEAGATYTAKAMQEALLSYRKKMRDDSEIARVSVRRTDLGRD